jgi:DNA repair protein RecN (Recombination protein N)
LGRTHQVFCVTHFAQVARFAGQQIKIEKEVRGGRTFTKLVTCNHEQRVAELARLMGGDANSENLRDHARGLLEGQREKDTKVSH